MIEAAPRAHGCSSPPTLAQLGAVGVMVASIAAHLTILVLHGMPAILGRRPWRARAAAAGYGALVADVFAGIGGEKSDNSSTLAATGEQGYRGLHREESGITITQSKISSTRSHFCIKPWHCLYIVIKNI